jgi:class 3 adenylate cyclase/tetratricopeptide (TPR) repeat protein
VITCPACAAEAQPGQRFCGHCGSSLARVCAACGAENQPDHRFCGSCGSALGDGGGAPSVATDAGAPGPGSLSERRLVSVLFADLVGFTTLSEHRDPEEVRELLSRYFERCRGLIERYGGTVEKFIGDAVMAVWGTPVAREDDPERAVRAALALTQAVTALGQDVGMPELRVRAGVLTGNTAVDLGADGEGMVLGDAVNTASRLQSLAAPGTVLVDDVTHRASEAAIAYEDAGTHNVKGREQPVHTWTALRVVAGIGGVRRGVGLEAPFVGRAAELERIVAASDEAVASARAGLVSVVGEAGSGKSRLLWEFYKYIDGVRKVVWWHQGRCLSYGEGVGYWALAEMVRARAGIIEEEGADSAREKLRAAVEQFVPDERERRLVEPRLAHLLGLEERQASDRADLFSGWRLFFERLSDDAPVILVFEDLQWADSGLLDFIDYLLEWSADRPLFVLALGRPELLDARPAWAADAILLTALGEGPMRELLAGLVPGLPGELAGRIVARADGVPLYAVETVRMLLDRGLLEQDGSRYVLTGEVGELDVPETLHALAAARLDELAPDERSVVQDASVNGQSFTPAAVAAVSGLSEAEAKRLLGGLVVKQVFGFNDDPRSAERGQYHFLQALLRTTAYATLSRRDRKERHLAAARHLQEVWGEDSPELAEVLAAHLLDAAEAEPAAPDAPQIRKMACETLAEAGQRALSLALGHEALRAFDRAVELADGDADRAVLLDQAGRAGLLNADYAVAHDRLERAIELFEALGDPESAARSLAAVAMALVVEDRLDEAIELGRRAVSALPGRGAERAAALATLSRTLAFSGDDEEAVATADAALEVAEPLREWRTIVDAFNTIAVVRGRQGRSQEAGAFKERALSLALSHDITDAAIRAYNNLADTELQGDQFADALTFAEPGLELAQARGDRRWEHALELMIATVEVARGHWDTLPELDEDGLPNVSDLYRRVYLPILARVQAARGEVAALERTLLLAAEREHSSNREYAAGPDVARAIALGAMGDPAQALEIALPIAMSPPSTANEDRREAFAEAGSAALTLDDDATVERLIEYVAELAPAFRSPLLRAYAARFAGLLAAKRSDATTADERLLLATRELREIEAPYPLAQVLLEHAELLRSWGREAEAAVLLTEATGIFTRLRATPWLERAQELGPRVTA